MNLNLNDIQHIIDDTFELNTVNNLNRELFFKIIDKSGIDLLVLSNKRKKNDYEPYHKFNFILKELHETKQIDIRDSCVYLETELLPVKDIINCLNEENSYMLRVSLAKKYNIPIKSNCLENFLYK